MARLVPTMLPTITPSPSAPRFARDHQGLGQAAALIELDVDDVEPANELRHVVETQGAFVGRDRDRAAIAIEVGLATARQRLLEQ